PCHDEVVQYRFEPVPAIPDSVHLVAEKLVNGRFEVMGELNLGYEPGSRSWLGEYRNSRVDILWRYRIRGKELIGTLVNLPDSTRLRDARLTRGRGKESR